MRFKAATGSASAGDDRCVLTEAEPANHRNDVAEGGETTFQESKDSRIQFSCKPTSGRMIAFPPFWTHPHTGMKPISGPKYIIGTYLHYV